MMYVYWLRAERAPGRFVGSLACCRPMTRHEWPGSRLRKQRCTVVRHTTTLGFPVRLVVHGGDFTSNAPRRGKAAETLFPYTLELRLRHRLPLGIEQCTCMYGRGSADTRSREASTLALAAVRSFGWVPTRRVHERTVRQCPHRA